MSGLVFPGSQAERAFARVLEGTETLVLSKATLDEVLGILTRKFSRESEALSQTAVLITEMGELVKPT
ncbi:MAG: hypothetical protein NPIRA03_16560 [Nitrospirales bacterium]|nr:MAG: hypothetical protein NPIRA03_16560 [Nitrospirales bacterium]